MTGARGGGGGDTRGEKCPTPTPLPISAFLLARRFSNCGVCPKRLPARSQQIGSWWVLPGLLALHAVGTRGWLAAWQLSLPCFPSWAAPALPGIPQAGLAVGTVLSCAPMCSCLSPKGAWRRPLPSDVLALLALLLLFSSEAMRGAVTYSPPPPSRVTRQLCLEHQAQGLYLTTVPRGGRLLVAFRPPHTLDQRLYFLLSFLTHRSGENVVEIRWLHNEG